MKRIIYTVLACAAFLAMLTGTSKKRPPREAGSIPKLAIPATTGWARHEVAGIRFLTPPNSTVTRVDQLHGVRIHLASGSEVRFETTAIDLTQHTQHEFHMYFAPDANIILHDTRAGDECQTNACTTMPILGSPLCVSAFPLTFDECAQIVAIVRSIEPL
jgi:hypothetical protein